MNMNSLIIGTLTATSTLAAGAQASSGSANVVQATPSTTLAAPLVGAPPSHVWY